MDDAPIVDISQVHRQFRQNYIQVHRPPEREDVIASNYPFKLFFAILLCMAAFAAFRTGWAIHEVNVKEGFDPLLSGAIAILGVIGIEGLVISHAVFRERNEIKSNYALELLAIGVGIAISMFAGAKISLTIIENLVDTLRFGVEYLLSGFLGIGFTLALWGFGEFIGGKRHAEQFKYVEAEMKYREAVRIYEQELTEAWEASDERRIAMHEIEMARQKADLEMEAERVRLETEKLAAQRDQEILDRKKRHELRFANRKVSGNFPETFRKVSESVDRIDWRNLPTEEQKDIAYLSVKEIMERYPVTDRTARNWKRLARELTDG